MSKETYQDGHEIGKPKIKYNYWQAALVKDQVFEHLINPPCHRGSVSPNTEKPV